MKYVLLPASLLAVAQPAIAQQPVAAPPDAAPQGPPARAGEGVVGITQNTATVEGSEPPGQVTRNFAGFKFGVGLSFTLDVGSSDRVKDAQLVNGIVRVTDEDNGIARLLLELHHLFTPGYNPEPNATQVVNGPFGTSAGLWGHGPFVAVQPGKDDLIDAIGAGWMIGLRQSLTSRESFNFGLGVIIDPNTRILGDGVVPNQPLPNNETAIRYTTEMQTGLLFLTSFSFF